MKWIQSLTKNISIIIRSFYQLAFTDVNYLLQELVFSDIGDENGDDLAYDVAISGDGLIMAVGARFGDPRSSNEFSGYVRLYTKSGTNWNMFQQISNGSAVTRFGSSVALSDNGSILVVASYYFVHIFERSSSSSLYGLLDTKDHDRAEEVAVSGDGNVVGVTISSSWPRFFVRNGDSFQARSAPENLSSDDDSGIAMNYDGTVVIIGDRFWSNRRGRARVFRWMDSGDGFVRYHQMGDDITGDRTNDFLGRAGSLSITYDGLTVAVGASGYDASLFDHGLVRVLDYDEIEEKWNKFGDDLLGDDTTEYFSTNALSSDGMHLIVGASGGSYAKTFERNGSNYEVIGDKIFGEGGRFGSSVDISADGSTFAIGAWTHDNDKGKVYLYDTFSSSSSSVAPSSNSNDYPSSVPVSSASSMTPSGHSVMLLLLCVLFRVGMY